MVYSVKEIYPTLQGEGAQSGRAAVFLRFAGCNLWSGRERDRPSALCRFCDTDFVGTDGPGGGRFAEAVELAASVAQHWAGAVEGGADIRRYGQASISAPEIAPAREMGPAQDEDASRLRATLGGGRPLVVCTGGEPLLQLDPPLISALHQTGFEIAVETNGTIECPAGIDWVCVSPKANTTLKLKTGNELKLVYPQIGASPTLFERLDFDYFFLQPMDGPAISENIAAAISYCRRYPQWRLSLQSHKLIGIA